MSRMSRNILALLIILSVSSSGWSTPADDLNGMLARAEALYYQADFEKSIELLLRADELLQQQAGHPQEKTDVKLQLALGFIGLNDTTRAKAYLQQLYALDADHQIDPQVFSPKVIQLAEEAKAEQNEIRCHFLMDEAQQQLSAGNADAVVKLAGSSQGKCSGLAPLNAKAADLLFKEGLDAYKKVQMEAALQKFRAVLRAEPKHELATEYLDLTESKLEVAADRAFLVWRKDFNKGEFELAARDYRELLSRSSSETIDEVRLEYRRALSSLVDSWNHGCANNDEAAMEEIRGRVNALLPEPAFAEDILSKMKTCTPTGCLQMSAALALMRLRSRVDPEFSSNVVSQLKVSPVTVHVKARINPEGDVATSEVYGGNPVLYPAVRDAFDKWKFSPAVTEAESRCFDTDIPIIINLAK
jgi:hypothetical protein